MKENKTEKSLNKFKEKKSSKFIEAIKRRWLVDGTKTILLVAIIIVMFIAVNTLMQKLELTPIDFSQDKLYTLTQESKDRVKNVDKEVNIYFIGYSEDDTNLELAKQYNKINDKIKAESVDINNRPDLAEKYEIEKDSTGIIVECGDKSKVLTENDLVTYDYSTYETINIAEEKLTSSIMSVVSDKIPKVYFLEGYSDLSLQKNMNYLNMYLKNEITEIDSLNVLSSGKIPDDCDTLVITTPSKDFDDIATNAIIDYINTGRNILWLNGAQVEKKDLKNVNKILELYAINPFEIGIIRETNANNMVANSPDLIIPQVQNSEILKDLYNGVGAIFVNATKININEDKMEEQNIVKTDLALTSDGAYFRSDFNNTQNAKKEDEESKNFLVGAQLVKTIKEANEENGESEITSKLIIYGENYFCSDYPINQSSQYPAIYYAQNKDVILNSIAYLVDRPEDIVARKSTGTVTYTATEEQNNIIKIVIFTVPILIIIAGIVVWIVRRMKK